MLLFDVGNTNICIVKYIDGILDNKITRIKTKNISNSIMLEESMKDLLVYADKIILASVVPHVTDIVISMCIRLNIPYYHMISDEQTVIKHGADDPHCVGADLVCDSAAVPNGSLVIDLGTAIKYIYVNDDTLKSVSIAPGVEVSLNALANSAALLDHTSIKVPKRILCTDTSECMCSGVTYAVAASVDGMIKRIRKEVGIPDLPVYATGGLASTIMPLCEEQMVYDEILTIRGLLRIYLEELKK